jgi:truncated hemoglobin YjbI
MMCASAAIQLAQAVFHLHAFLATHKQRKVMRVAITMKQHTAVHVTLQFMSCLCELPVLALFMLYYRYAEQHSGVSAAEANCLDHSSLYSLLGDNAICQISTAFYTRVFNDEKWFRDIFATSTQAEATRNQVEFLIEKLGGPPVYTERKGRHRLIGRHSPYDISPAAAERWLEVIS